MDSQGFISTAVIAYLMIWVIIALPIIISLVFLTWRFISINLLNKRVTYRAPLTALVLNSIFTACVVAIQFTITIDSYVVNIGILLAVLTIIFWIHDSLSWHKTKKGSRYLVIYKLASIGLILILAAWGIVDGMNLYSIQMKYKAEDLAKIQSIGTPIYLPKDMTDANLYISSTKTPHIEIGTPSMTSSQYNNTSNPSKLSCDSVISNYPNKEEHPPRCVYISNINGIKLWNIMTDDDIEEAFAITGTTTIIITRTGYYDVLTRDGILDYVRSLHAATGEEIVKYPISG